MPRVNQPFTPGALVSVTARAHGILDQAASRAPAREALLQLLFEARTWGRSGGVSPAGTKVVAVAALEVIGLPCLLGVKIDVAASQFSALTGDPRATGSERCGRRVNSGAAEARGRHRHVAAVPLGSAPHRGRREPAQDGLRPGKVDLGKYMRNETRFRMVEQQDPKRFAKLLERARIELANRFIAYEHLAKLAMPKPVVGEAAQPPAHGTESA